MARRVTNGVLTESAVARIKGLLKSGGQSRRQIAKAWGVGLETIARIDREDTWSWVVPEMIVGRLDELDRELTYNRPTEPLAKDSAANESLVRLQALLVAEPPKRVDWIELKSQPIDELMDLTNQGDSDEQID